MSLLGKPKPVGGQKCESAVVRRACHATRGNKVISAQYGADGHAVITCNGKELPSLNELVDDMGFDQAWELLTSMGVAHSAIADKLVRKGRFG